MTRIVDACLLALVYALVLGSGNPLDWTMGFALGLALPRAFPLPDTSALVHTPRFVLGVLLLVAKGTATTLPALLSRRRAERSGYVTAVFPESTAAGAAALAHAATMSPGTAVALLDADRRRLEIHAIDARRPELVRRELARFYRRYQRQSFP